jgi:hypothetical protein
MMRSRVFLLLLLAPPAIGAHAGDAGYVPKAIDLLDRPAADAKPVAQLVRQQPVEVISRKGSWANVNARAKSGWIRLIDLRLNAIPSWQIAAGACVKSASDSGIRGFSEEELLAGTPSRSELDELKLFSVAVKDASSFARSAGLKPRRQDYLDGSDYLSLDQLPDDFFDE